MSATQDLSAVLTPEDVEFLTALANELKTQDTAGTARPVIYQMRRKTPPFRAKISGADPGGVNPAFPVARCIA